MSSESWVLLFPCLPHLVKRSAIRLSPAPPGLVAARGDVANTLQLLWDAALL